MSPPAGRSDDRPMDPEPVAQGPPPPASPTPLRVTWIVVRTVFFAVLSIWVLVGVLALVRFATADEDAAGTIACPAGSYPASAGADAHRCFPNGAAPAPGFTPDPMTDHQREPS